MAKTYEESLKEDEPFRGGSQLYFEAIITDKYPNLHNGTHTYRAEEQWLPGMDRPVYYIHVLSTYLKSKNKTVPGGATKYYHYEKPEDVVKKERIVLHYTAGLLTGSMGALMIPDQDCVSVAYVIGRDGTIYKLFDDEYWANSLGIGNKDDLKKKWGMTSREIEKSTIAIEIINVGWLKKIGNKLYKGSSFDKKGKFIVGSTAYCSDTETEAYEQRTYRDQDYFATYTEAQYASIKQLLQYLTNKYQIDYHFIEEAKRYDKFTAKNDDWKGIVSHVNFRDNDGVAGSKAWGKWDIGPAFRWDLIMPGNGFRFPLNLNGNLVNANDLKKDNKLLAVTQKNIDAYYKHVEKDTKGGFFPLGENTVWHGGVHLFAPKDTPVLSCADGEVIAARLEKEVKGKEQFYGSRNFILVRHHLDRQTIRQLYSLWVPMKYRVKDPSITVSIQGTNGFKVQQGDVFERIDKPTMARTLKSIEGTSNAVKLDSIAPGLELVKTLEVAKQGVVFREQPNNNPVPQGPVFPLPLVPEDELTLVSEMRIDAFNAAKSNGWYKVKLTRLANVVSIIKEYKVTGDYYNFRSAEGDVDDPNKLPAKDDGRRGDLHQGDVLELLEQDVEGGGDDAGWRWVRVKSLGGKQDIGKYTLKQGWSFRSEASKDKTKVPLKLAQGDVVELIQKHSRVFGSDKFDLVKLISLAKGEKVDSHYMVTAAAGTKVYAEETGDTSTVAAKGAKLEIIARPMGTRIHVKGPSGQGWLEPTRATVSLVKAERPETGWCKALLNTEGYVDALDSSTATPESASARLAVVGGACAAGDTADDHADDAGYGFIKLPDKAFAADGTKRPDLHAGAIGKEGFVHFQNDNMTPDGDGRAKIFDDLRQLPGTITFIKNKLEPEQTDIPTEVVDALMANPVYYSLYMHLNNEVELEPSNAKLKDYPWIPRTAIVRFEITSPATMYQEPSCTTPLFTLLKGDTLQVAKGGTHALPKYQVQLDALVKGEGDPLITTAIEVKSDVTLWLDDKQTRRALGLRQGDKLRPAEGWTEGAKSRNIEIVSINPSAGPVRYRVKKIGKFVALYKQPNVAANVITKFLVGDELVIVDRSAKKNKSGQWTAVRVKSLVTGVGKRGAPIPRVATPDAGYVLFSADAFEPVDGDRNSELSTELASKQGYLSWGDGSAFALTQVKRSDLHKGKEKSLLGYFTFQKEKAKPTMEPDEAMIERLRKGEVVGFGVSDVDPRTGANVLKYPAVTAGTPLWGSGTYGAPDNRKEMIHWEIFSETNLLRKEHLDRWTEAEDDGDDYNMDSDAILKIIEKGTEHVVKDNWDTLEDKVHGDMLTADKVEKLYQNKDVAEALRHYSCQFVIEWGIDLDKALPKLQREGGLLAKFGITKSAEGYQTTTSWIGGTKNRIKPLLWWDEAVAVKDKPGVAQVELPGTKKLWHYNPIAFLEAYSELDLEKQKNS
jgi:N-acetyl-anhydromuramyl-L-alanine amidase AmpD